MCSIQESVATYSAERGHVEQIRTVVHWPPDLEYSTLTQRKKDFFLLINIYIKASLHFRLRLPWERVAPLLVVLLKSCSYLIQRGNGSWGVAAEAVASLDGWDGALEVGAVEQLRKLQEAVAQDEQLQERKTPQSR